MEWRSRRASRSPSAVNQQEPDGQPRPPPCHLEHIEEDVVPTGAGSQEEVWVLRAMTWISSWGWESDSLTSRRRATRQVGLSETAWGLMSSSSFYSHWEDNSGVSVFVFRFLATRAPQFFQFILHKPKLCCSACFQSHQMRAQSHCGCCSEALIAPHELQLNMDSRVKLSGPLHILLDLMLRMFVM